MSSTGALKIAQIIADLQTLQNADPQAALFLLTPQNAPRSPATTSPLSRQSSSGPQFNKLGRRINAPTTTTSRSHHSQSQSSGTGGGGGVKIPSFGREASSASTSSMSMSMAGRSGASTPLGNTGVEVEQSDEDLARAKTLLQLFEMRGKFKQMGDTGLSRAKQRVDDVVAKYAKAELEEREKVARARYLRL